MTIQAGFSQVDITPPKLPVRTYFSSADHVIDALSACAAVFSDGGAPVAFLSLDVVIVEWEYVARIREGIAVRRDIPAESILVCATHNHACPAVVDRPGSAKDEPYLDYMVDRGVEVVIEAYDRLAPGEIGLGRGYEARIGFNRRFVKLDGTVISQPPSMEGILRCEGVTDPGLGVVAFRGAAGSVSGLLVNYSCHATHLMGKLSAGYPGAMRDALRPRLGDKAVCVFLNGACGNVIHRNYADPDLELSKERCGVVLADDVSHLLSGVRYDTEATVAAAECLVPTKYRDVSGLAQNLPSLREAYNVFQSVYERGWYECSLQVLQALHAKSDHEDARVQVLRVGDAYFGAVPAEYFAENGLRIKELSPQRNTFVVSLANGWLGYVPHPAAFERRGGHETTWALWSKMEEGAGDILADSVLDLIDRISG